jgi:hypothetical protein
MDLRLRPLPTTRCGRRGDARGSRDVREGQNARRSRPRAPSGGPDSPKGVTLISGIVWATDPQPASLSSQSRRAPPAVKVQRCPPAHPKPGTSDQRCAIPLAAANVTRGDIRRRRDLCKPRPPTSFCSPETWRFALTSDWAAVNQSEVVQRRGAGAEGLPNRRLHCLRVQECWLVGS